MLPGSHRVRIAQLNRTIDVECLDNVPNNPERRPVAAANDVTGPRGGDPATAVEERMSERAGYQLGTRLRVTVGIMTAKPIVFRKRLAGSAVFIDLGTERTACKILAVPITLVE